jgi:hypothetical protein
VITLPSVSQLTQLGIEPRHLYRDQPILTLALRVLLVSNVTGRSFIKLLFAAYIS